LNPIKKAKYMRRIRVENMLVQGFRPSEIIEMLHKEWGVSRKTIQNYILGVHKDWREVVLDDAKFFKAKFLDRLENLYKEAFDAGQYGIAAKIQDQINKICGIYETEKKLGDGPEVITISATNSQVKSLPPGQSEIVDAETDENDEAKDS
jgi:hypothetical protein